MAKEDLFYVDQISAIDAAATDTASLDDTIPEIWAARTLEFMQSNLVLGSIPVYWNTELLGPGDILHLPIFDQVSTEAAAKTEGSAAAITELTSSEVTATPTTYANAVQLTDEMLERTKVSSLMDEAVRRLGYGMALKLEKDIRVKLEAAVNAGTNAGQLIDKTGQQFSEDFFANARRVMRKNAPNASLRGLIAVIHPDHQIVLEKSTKFVDASVYGSNQPLLTGEIGTYLGIRFLISDVGRQGAADFDSDSTNDQDVWVLGPDAFRVAWKRKPVIKTQYFAREGYTDVVGTAGWAVTKYRTEHIVRIVADVAP